MSRNNNYQQLQEFVSSIPTQQKDIVCNDCGGISATKIQQLLSTLEGSTQLSANKKIKFKRKLRKKNTRSKSMNKKKISSRNNNRKNSVRRKKKTKIHKRISHPTKTKNKKKVK